MVSARHGLEDQVAIVTGAAGAIGSAVATEFAAMGAKVACLDVVAPGDVVERINGAECRAIAVRADLTDEEAVTSAVAEVLEWGGRADVLVNMAGLYYGVPRVPFWEIDLGTWGAVVESNLRTAFLCARAVSASHAVRRPGTDRQC